MSVEEPEEITEDEANEPISNNESQDGKDGASPAVGDEDAEGNDDSAEKTDGEGDE